MGHVCTRWEVRVLVNVEGKKIRLLISLQFTQVLKVEGLKYNLYECTFIYLYTVCPNMKKVK